MGVDVATEIEIRQPRNEVAAYACDPDNATSWYRNIEHVEWKTATPLAVGSRVAFVARFLGRRLACTYAVREMVPHERFVMSTSDGPFPMETTYTWQGGDGGLTRMKLRNRGEPAGFSKVAAPAMASAMRRANRRISKLSSASSRSRDRSGTHRRKCPRRRQSPCNRAQPRRSRRGGRGPQLHTNSHLSARVGLETGRFASRRSPVRSRLAPYQMPRIRRFCRLFHKLTRAEGPRVTRCRRHESGR